MMLLPVVSIADGDYFLNTGSFLVLQMLWSPNDVKQKIEKTINNDQTQHNS